MYIAQDAMIFFLSTLNCRTYAVLQTVFDLYENAELIPAPKSASKDSKLDCKGNIFKRKAETGVLYTISNIILLTQQDVSYTV